MVACAPHDTRGDGQALAKVRVPSALLVMREIDAVGPLNGRPEPLLLRAKVEVPPAEACAGSRAPPRR